MLPSLSLKRPPKKIRKALELVQSVVSITTGHVFVAGGCLRDEILDQIDYKDIDIFITAAVNFGDTKHTISQLKKLDGIEIVGEDIDDVDSSKVVNSTRAVIKEKRIDVVVLDEQYSVDEVLESFDIGLCKVAWNGKLWTLHEDFVSDLNAERIRVCAAGAYSPESIRARVEKLKRNYPDFTVDTVLLEKLEADAKKYEGDDLGF